ncbi:MAG: NAD(P)H-dependent oxidoreductase, partial [Deltaproteobacteria bacterium]|nr:NAD(P)H-dependent oxidoreductase [Deltaproteobacteria bacterium]
ATPLYCWGFSSQMKALIDRHLCLATGYDTPDYKSVVEGKRTALLVTCDGPVENNADLIQECFNRLNDYAKAIVVGKYVVPGWYTEPDSVLDKAKDTAKRMASDIAKT